MNKNTSKIRIIFIVVLPMNMSIHAMAQENDSTQWTLGKCIEYALDNNLTLQRSLLNVQSGEIIYDQSKMALLPSVNADAGTGFNWGRSIDPTSNQFITERIQFANAGLNTSVTLFNGFALRNKINQNRLAFEAKKYDLEKSKNDIIRNVILYYTSVIFNQELLKNARLKLTSSDGQLKRAEKQEREGAISKSSFYDLVAQRASDEVSVVNQENKLNLSMLQLRQLLQIPASALFDISRPVTDSDEHIISEAVSVDEIYSISEQNMPEIKSTDLNVQSAEYGLKSAKGGYLPTVTARAGLSTNFSSAADRRRFIPDGEIPAVVEQNPAIGFVKGNKTPVLSNKPKLARSGQYVDGYAFLDQLSDNLREYVSLNISIPIFNRYQTRANVQRALITKKQAEITAKETRNTLRQTIETAQNDVLATAKSYNASLKQVQARAEAYKTAQKKHELNAMSNIDYQIVENNLFQAKSDLLRAKYDYIFKLKIIDFYQGKTLDF